MNPKAFMYCLMIAMVSFGTVNTIVLKGQDRQHVHDKIYLHPFFQCSCMMMGEYLCLLAYFIYRLCTRKSRDPNEDSPGRKKAIDTGLKLTYSKLLFAIPAGCDITATSINFFGLMYVTASVYQMMRGGIIVITAFASILFLGRKLYRHHWISIVIILIGVTTVGFASILWGEKGSKGTKPFGVILLIAAQFFASGTYVAEEKLLRNLYVKPIQAVGYEGLAGCTIFTILLPIFYFIKLGPYEVAGSTMFPFGRLEDVPWALYQVFTNVGLCFLVIGGIISIALFNFFGVSITKYASAAHRATIDPCRTFFIWLISYIIGWEGVIPVQFVGFFLLTLGMLIFNEILVIPWFGMGKNTKKALAEKLKDETGELTQEDKEIIEDRRKSEFVGTSPHAAYATSDRNLRNILREETKRTASKALLDMPAFTSPVIHEMEDEEDPINRSTKERDDDDYY